MKKFIYSFLLINILFLAFATNVYAKDECGKGYNQFYKDDNYIYCCQSNAKPTEISANAQCDSVSNTYQRNGVTYCSDGGKLQNGKCHKYVVVTKKAVEKKLESKDDNKKSNLTCPNNYYNVGEDQDGAIIYCCKVNQETIYETGIHKCFEKTSSTTNTRSGQTYCTDGKSRYIKSGCWQYKYEAMVVTKTSVTALKPVTDTEEYGCKANEFLRKAVGSYVYCCTASAFDDATGNCYNPDTKLYNRPAIVDKTNGSRQEETNFSTENVEDTSNPQKSGKNKDANVIESSGYEIDSKTDYKGDSINVCKTKQVIDSMKKINVVLDLIKLLAPIILVLVSTLSLSKEVTSFDDPDTKKYIKEFIIKFVLCVMLYFLPTLLSYLFSATTKASDEGGYSSCIACALNAKECPTDLVCFDEKGKSTSCPTEYGAGDCKSILGDPTDENSVAYYAQIALNVIKYVGILLCIILSSLDIIKAIMGNDKDAHKPVVEKTIKRFMYAAILFFVPSLVNALFTILGLFSSCGIK